MQNEKKVVELNIQDVLPNRFQPRIKFDENSINELAVSVKKYGVIQPIVVRQIGDKYEIIAGERRYKASVIAGKQTIPAIIYELSDKDSVEIALIENVQREDLTPIEKAISYKKILDMGYITQEELAEKVGKSQSSIANTLRLLGLSEEVQEALLENKISERHARSLLKMKDNPKQVEMLNRIIEERLTVRKTDEEIEKMLNNENEVITPVEQTMPEEVVTIPDIAPVAEEPKAPGFMDIDKIATEAQDILQPKPIADMDNLLQPENNVSLKEEEEERDEDILKPGKFFNFFGEEQQDTSAGADNYNFNNFFNNDAPTSIPNMGTDSTVPAMDVPTYSQPVVEPTPVMPTYEVPSMPTMDVPTYNQPMMESTPVMPTYEVPSMPAVDVPVYNQPMMESTPVMPTYEVPSMPAVDVPVYNQPMAEPTPVMPTYEVPSMPTMDVPTYNQPMMESTPVMPTYEVPSMPAVDVPVYNQPMAEPTPVMPTMDISTYNQPEVESTPAMPTYEVPNVPTMDVPTYNQPEVESTPVMPTYEVPTAPMYDASIPEATTPDVPAYTIPSAVTYEQPVVEQPTPSVQIPTTKDIRIAINTVRDCADTLERSGFTVDVEEIDFEDSYQVIFKISKN